MDHDNNGSAATCMVCNQSAAEPQVDSHRILCAGHQTLYARGFTAIIEINYSIEVDASVVDPLDLPRLFRIKLS